MQRFYFQSNGLTLSYLDSGGDGNILIALHAHLMEATTFMPLSSSLAPSWRVIALDQRGHGYSDHALTYTRDDYINDLSALFDHLKIKKAIILGNSLGGLNAYQFAAQFPHCVHGLIIEDIGAELHADMSFCLAWQGVFSSKEALEHCVGSRFLPYFKDSIRQVADGWRFAFEPSEMMTSVNCSNGDHWKDWLATDCPTLLLRGSESRVTTYEQMEKMAHERRNTKFIEIKAGHVIHKDNFKDFNNALITFLENLFK